MIEPKSRRTVEQAVIRAKLREPARLYLWPIVLVLVIGFVGAGITTQEWGDWALALLAPALGVAGAAEAVRASVYSEAGHFQSLHQAASRWADITRAPQ
jgi:hypothetical protein